jgi:hypothetical protein
LVCNLGPLLSTPQFRTYWVQRNVSELRTFQSSVSDLFERKDGFEEQRILLRKAAAETSPASSALADALRYATERSSLYRAWAEPTAGLLQEALQQVIFGEPMPENSLYNPMAPSVTAEAGPVGSETDLETRIDQSAFVRSSKATAGPMVTAILKMQPTALLHVQTTAVLQDQVFVMPTSGVVIICKQPDIETLKNVLAQISTVLQTGGLDPLRLSVEGNAILVTRMDLRPVASLSTVSADVTYAAVYQRALDWPQYTKLFGLIDRTPSSPETQQSQSAPPFFSRNLQSLGESWSRLQRVSIVSEERSGSVHETLRYEVSPP